MSAPGCTLRQACASVLRAMPERAMQNQDGARALPRFFLFGRVSSGKCRCIRPGPEPESRDSSSSLPPFDRRLSEHDLRTGGMAERAEGRGHAAGRSRTFVRGRHVGKVPFRCKPPLADASGRSNAHGAERAARHPRTPGPGEGRVAHPDPARRPACHRSRGGGRAEPHLGPADRPGQRRDRDRGRLREPSCGCPAWHGKPARLPDRPCNLSARDSDFHGTPWSYEGIFQCSVR